MKNDFTEIDKAASACYAYLPPEIKGIGKYRLSYKSFVIGFRMGVLSTAKTLNTESIANETEDN